MFDKMNMEEILSKAKELQENLIQKQNEAAKQIIEASVGGGMVNVKMNGKMEVLSINIDKEVVDPKDVETLEDLVRSAVNEAIRQAREVMGGELSKLTGGLNIPGINS